MQTSKLKNYNKVIYEKVEQGFGEKFGEKLLCLYESLQEAHPNEISLLTVFTKVRFATERNPDAFVQYPEQPRLSLNSQQKSMFEELVNKYVYTLKLDHWNLDRLLGTGAGKWSKQHNKPVYNTAVFVHETGVIDRDWVPFYDHAKNLFGEELIFELRLVFDPEYNIYDPNVCTIGLTEKARPYLDLLKDIESELFCRAKEKEGVSVDRPMDVLSASETINVFKERMKKMKEKVFLEHDPSKRELKINAARLIELRKEGKGWHYHLRGENPLVLPASMFEKAPDDEYFDKKRNEKMYVYRY